MEAKCPPEREQEFLPGVASQGHSQGDLLGDKNQGEIHCWGPRPRGGSQVGVVRALGAGRREAGAAGLGRALWAVCVSMWLTLCWWYLALGAFA